MIDDKLKQLSEDELLVVANKIVSVRFDESNAHRPYIHIRFPKQDHTYTIDIIKSLEQDPTNIAHPIIVAAIERYTAAIQWRRYPKDPLLATLPDEGTAKTCLHKLSEALISGAEERSRSKDTSAVIVWTLNASDAPLYYFEFAWSVLRAKDVVKIRNAEAKLQRIEQILWENMPDENHEPFMKFLRDLFITKNSSINRLPQRGGGTALRTTFLAWQNKISHKAMKDYLSRGNVALRSLRKNDEWKRLVKIRDGEYTLSHGSPFNNPRIFFATGVVQAEEEIKDSRLSWKKEQTSPS